MSEEDACTSDVSGESEQPGWEAILCVCRVFANRWGKMVMASVAAVRAGVLFALVGILLAAPGTSDMSVPAARRFHAKFVVDRIEPRRPLSTDDRSTPTVDGLATAPTPARTRSTTRCREGCLQKVNISNVAKRMMCDVLPLHIRDQAVIVSIPSSEQYQLSVRQKATLPLPRNVCPSADVRAMVPWALGRNVTEVLLIEKPQCWDVCNRNHQIRKENDLAHRLLLSLVRLIRNESVVTADIEWTTPEELVQHQPHPVVPSPLAASENVERLSRIARDGVGAREGVSRIMQTLANRPAPSTPSEEPHLQEYHQCLVSWEISGGGLTGNLLTETSKVELSLWPNTKYHVHVTCRNKETDSLIRSSSLLVDTREAVIVSLQGTTSTTTETPPPSPPPPPPPPALGNGSINSAIQFSTANRAESAQDNLPSPVDDDDDDDLQMLAERQHHRHHSFWPFNRSRAELSSVTSGSSKEIVILGVFVALLALVLVALTVVIMVRRKPGPHEDRELLIESEILPKILHV
uniref:Fibronectin type-III domain-containing protein n=1 Tax=Anopheles culicifacies TaxID=139723 RepID=A0A182MUB6_9DIPT